METIMIIDDPEIAMDWVRLWMAVKNVEGENASFEEGCHAWFVMQRKQREFLDKKT